MENCTTLSKKSARFYTTACLLLFLTTTVTARNKAKSTKAWTPPAAKKIAQLLGLQTLTMGFFAFLFAIPAGVIQAYVMIFVINKRSFGWSLDWNLENSFYTEIFFLAILASLISVIYPVLYTNKVKLSEALRND